MSFDSVQQGFTQAGVSIGNFIGNCLAEAAGFFAGIAQYLYDATMSFVNLF